MTRWVSGRVLGHAGRGSGQDIECVRELVAAAAAPGGAGEATHVLTCTPLPLLPDAFTFPAVFVPAWLAAPFFWSFQ